jgi:hypothetical protein
VAKPSLAMYSRQVSRSAEVVKKGQKVYLYGMSTRSPGSAKLVWSFNGKSGWKVVAGQHKAGGGIVYASPAVASTVYVALRDAGGVGPARIVKAK